MAQTTIIRCMVLAAGLLVASCGPQVHELSACSAPMYDEPSSWVPCSSYAPYCGDGACGAAESYLECPEDCPPPTCGDGVCEAGEDLGCADCDGLVDELSSP
jgi:hypothetical protein